MRSHLRVLLRMRGCPGENCAGREGVRFWNPQKLENKGS
jgi:hypothetical protein